MYDVCDLFAGIGGWSEAARQTLGPDTRCTAVDADADVLAYYKANHPHSNTVVRTLPASVRDLLPDDRSHFFIFASPPCTKLSVANNNGVTTDEREEALQMIEWTVQLMMATECRGWWLEQVATPHVVQRLEGLRCAHPDAFDFDVFDFGRQFGVPQSRRRVLASRPDAMRRLRDVRVPRVVVADVLTPPCHVTDGVQCTTLFSIGGNGNKNPSLRSVTDVSFTVTGNALYWAFPECRRYRKLTPREIATLQTFPHTFLLPQHKGPAYKALGNAIPPLAAQQCIHASLLVVCDDDDLRARVTALEERMSAITEWMRRMSAAGADDGDNHVPQRPHHPYNPPL